MLVFLDESYEALAEGGLRHAYAGFGIAEHRYRHLMAAVHQAKRTYFVEAGAMSAAEIHQARSTHIVTSSAPEDAELKASKLLSNKQANWHATHGNAPGLLLVDEVLDCLRGCDAQVFGVLSYPASASELHGKEGFLPVQHQRLLERVEKWMAEAHPESAAVIVPDTVHDGIDRTVSKRMADYLFRSRSGQAMRHIVPSPFWVDSQSSVGSQVADIIAHILMNGMKPVGARKPLDELWRKVVAMEYRSTDGRTRGIRRVQKQQTGAEAH